MNASRISSVASHLARGVTSLRLDWEAPFDDLDPLTDFVQNAKVVALGSAVRQSHELSRLTGRTMRFLVERHGFRSLLLEGDEMASIALDTHVRTGEGDLTAILLGARPFWRFAEIRDAVRWIRTWNERNPSEHVRVAYVLSTPRDAIGHASGAEDIERRLADATVAWHEHTGHRIVYWGGLAHTAVGVAAVRNAGSHLRLRFGSAYVSIGLTFHHGSAPMPVGDPPNDSIEAVLGAVEQETYVLSIHHDWPEPVRDWLEAPAKTRLIGPGTHELTGPSLRTWFDFVVHARRVTPAQPLV